MSNYSYSELQNMQKRAMERVREMQRNSRSVLETAQFDLENSEKVSKESGSKYEPPRSAPVKTKVTNMPPNFPRDKHYPDFKEYFQEQKPRKTEREPQVNANLLESVISEPDKILILGLLLLLKSEGADEALMMALMYIMA